MKQKKLPFSTETTLEHFEVYNNAASTTNSSISNSISNMSSPVANSNISDAYIFTGNSYTIGNNMRDPYNFLGNREVRETFQSNNSSLTAAEHVQSLEASRAEFSSQLLDSDPNDQVLAAFSDNIVYNLTNTVENVPVSTVISSLQNSELSNRLIWSNLTNTIENVPVSTIINNLQGSELSNRLIWSNSTNTVENVPVSAVINSLQGNEFSNRSILRNVAQPILENSLEQNSLRILTNVRNRFQNLEPENYTSLYNASRRTFEQAVSSQELVPNAADTYSSVYDNLSLEFFYLWGYDALSQVLIFYSQLPVFSQALVLAHFCMGIYSIFRFIHGRLNLRITYRDFSVWIFRHINIAIINLRHMTRIGGVRQVSNVSVENTAQLTETSQEVYNNSTPLPFSQEWASYFSGFVRGNILPISIVVGTSLSTVVLIRNYREIYNVIRDTILSNRSSQSSNLGGNNLANIRDTVLSSRSSQPTNLDNNLGNNGPRVFSERSDNNNSRVSPTTGPATVFAIFTLALFRQLVNLIKKF